MKRLSLTVKTLIAAALVLSASSCSEKAAETTTPAAVETSEAGNAGEAAPKSNIRYIDADSVISAYTLAQQLFAEQQREVNKVQQWHESKQRELQSLANSISQKQQNNVYLSQASMEADVQNFQKKGEEADRYLNTQQQRLTNSELQIRARLSDSITSAVRAYNATRGYDAILLREAGVYFNPALDVTGEIIAILNSRVQGEKK
ncbi:MAG: OmpH family outer membrane protein [Muribaculaceae bacterium]|jgi:outer membrane protein|nr:OmpH family outer membrane protein [Muribaculaceae bacterium]